MVNVYSLKTMYGMAGVEYLICKEGDILDWIFFRNEIVWINIQIYVVIPPIPIATTC